MVFVTGFGGIWGVWEVEGLVASWVVGCCAETAAGVFAVSRLCATGAVVWGWFFFLPRFLRFVFVVAGAVPLGVGSLAGAINEAPWCSNGAGSDGGAGAVTEDALGLVFLVVAATVLAFLFLISFLNWGQEV